MEEKLPAVAKSIYMTCTKCEADRWFRVIAHTTSTSAKVECEVCGAKRTYKLSKTGKTTKKTSRSKASQKEVHYNLFVQLRDGMGDSEPQKYNMRENFEQDSALDHPKFGLGFIKTATPDRIEVIFEDQVRSLVHNR